MPIYEYTCRQCGSGFDRRLKYEERNSPQTCPACGHADVILRFSAPALVRGGAGLSPAPVCPTSGQPCGCSHGGHRH